MHPQLRSSSSSSLSRQWDRNPRSRFGNSYEYEKYSHDGNNDINNNEDGNDDDNDQNTSKWKGSEGKGGRGKDRLLCHALFHPHHLRGVPLAFVHCSLSHGLSAPRTMEDVFDNDDVHRFLQPRQRPNVATFYSIASTVPGLAGLGIGRTLIGRAVDDISTSVLVGSCAGGNKTNDTVHNKTAETITTSNDTPTFVTLSPLPGFRNWLMRKSILDGTFSTNDDREKRLLKVIADVISWWPSSTSLSSLHSSSYQDHHRSDRIIKNERHDREAMDDPLELKDLMSRLIKYESELMHLAAVYLCLSKKGVKGPRRTQGIRNMNFAKDLKYYDNKDFNSNVHTPLDPVARFHVGNGAEIYRLNFLADRSSMSMRRRLVLFFLQ